tara:strand:- start:7879 stop:8265 length:387 start_codon:yes stop_codon:yes gene_type:complete
MCRLFIGARSDLWESRAKSLRIDGVATSIRMETFFWMTLDEIAARDDMTTNQLITRLYHEAMDADHDIGNFTSFLRVCCGRYHSLMAAGDIPQALSQSIGGLQADAILAREEQRLAGRRSGSGPSTVN